MLLRDVLNRIADRVAPYPWVCPCAAAYNEISAFCWNCKGHYTKGVPANQPPKEPANVSPNPNT